jgi:hypothetical protein
MKPRETKIEAAVRANADLRVRDSDDEIVDAAVAATTFQRALERVGRPEQYRVSVVRHLAALAKTTAT